MARDLPPASAEAPGGDRGLRPRLRPPISSRRSSRSSPTTSSTWWRPTGLPQPLPHWRFGMEYDQLSKGYEYSGLSKIYELVINNNPTYLRLSARGQRRRRSEAGDGPRLRPRRLLQEQLHVLADQPPHDGRDGEPRHPGAPLHRSLWGGPDRGFHRSLPLAREPDRLPRPFHPAETARAHRRGTGGQRGSGRGARHRNRPRVHARLPQSQGVHRGERRHRGRASASRNASPRTPSATFCCSWPTTRRSSAGSARSSPCCATRLTTSRPRARPRS